MNKLKKMQGSIMLFVAACIWGCAFVAQREGMEYIGPFSFNAIRSLIGVIILLPIGYLLKGRRQNQATNALVETKELRMKKRKDLWIAGAVCGLCLFFGASLQQFGIQYTSAGKAGFITALYIIFVPIVGLVLGKKHGKLIWLCIGIALVGLYLLCMKEGFKIEKGDLLVFLSAIVYTFHIISIDYFSQKVNGVFLSCFQFGVLGILSFVGMILFETITWKQIMACSIPLLYAGVLSCAVAYTLQILGQRSTKPTVASLIMSLESVVAVIAGMIILKEKLTLKELLGCSILLLAILLAQLPDKRESKKTIEIVENGVEIADNV